MDRVVITGARGEVGGWVTAHFVKQGWHVTGVDISKPSYEYPSRRDNLVYREVDLTQRGPTQELLEEANPDVVVHLAAIPRNGITSRAETFKVNVSTSYNVLETAGRLDVRAVWTSSDSIYGAVQAPEPPQPSYLPIDETYPKTPGDPYGTSKLVGEQIAQSVVRKHDTTIISIRPVKIVLPGKYDWLVEFKESFDPEIAERDGGYWSYVDARDVARAIEKASKSDLSGHEPILIAADENYLDRPTVESIEQVFGGVPEDSAISGRTSAYSIKKAAECINWTPKYSWRDTEEEDVSLPEFVGEE